MKVSVFDDSDPSFGNAAEVIGARFYRDMARFGTTRSMWAGYIVIGVPAPVLNLLAAVELLTGRTKNIPFIIGLCCWR
jgi:hypothetical protein